MGVTTRSGKRIAAAAALFATASSEPTKRSKSTTKLKKSTTTKSKTTTPKNPKRKTPASISASCSIDPLLVLSEDCIEATTKQSKSTTTKPKKTKPKKTTLKNRSIASTSATCSTDPLLILSEDCIEATFVCRPSKRNRSPYVADIELPDGRHAICHMPNLDMGGKCAPGVKLWVEPFKDKKTGQAVGPNAINPKYNTPKCEFSTRLVRVDESYLDGRYIPTWVGGHPALGESLAEELIARHVAELTTIPGMEPIDSFQGQVMIGEHTRADFMLTPSSSSGKKRIVEVKTVVDTDYCASWTLPENLKCLFTSPNQPYQRTALFPWGQSKQKGPDGETVVSTRAIKHVRELTQLVQRHEFEATILFIVIRGDAEKFQPNFEACPSFARYLKEAQDGGVQLLAKRVKWDEMDTTSTTGTTKCCYDDKWLDIEFPTEKKAY